MTDEFRENQEEVIEEPQVPQQDPEHTPLANAEVDATEAPDVEQAAPAEPPAGPIVTRPPADSAVGMGLIPNREEGWRPETTTDPSFLTSTRWAMQDYGITGNLARWTQQALDEEDPEATKEIEKNLPELMYGVGEEYEDYLRGQPNLEAAEREAERLRTLAFRNALRENESVPQAMAAGFLGFVLDPINLVPGALIVKGMSASAKLASAAGLRGANSSLAKTAATWGAAGATEELVRNAPRLKSDPTYRMDEYLTDAALGLAFGAGLPVVGAGVRKLPAGVRKAAEDIKNSARAMGVDMAFRSTVETAHRVSNQVAGADGNIVQRARAIDPARAVREAKRAAKQQIDDQVRELRTVAAEAPVREAVMAADSNSAAEATRSVFERVLRAVAARTRDDSFAERAEAAQQSIGAAKRTETLATQAGDVAADVKQSVREVGQAAVEETERARAAAQKLIDDTADLTEPARQRIRQVVDAAYDDQRRGIDLALEKRGVRPIRRQLNNKDHTAATSEALQSVRRVSNTAFQRMADGIEEMLPEGFSMAKRANFALSRAYVAAGISKGATETWAQAYERTVKGMSHVQRAAVIQKLTDAWSRNVDVMKAEIDARPDLTGPAKEELIRRIDEAQFQVSGELDLVGVLAANPFDDMIVTKAQWAQISDGWRQSGNMSELSKQFVDSKLQGAVKHQFAHLTNSLASRMMRSEVPLAQWFTMNVLETPAGFGGQLDRAPLTASIYAETLNNRSLLPVLQGWEDLMRSVADAEGWNMLRRIQNKQGNARTHNDVQRISREVMLEMNRRHFGAPSTAPEHIRKFADVLERQYGDLHDLQNGHVAGIHDGNKIKGYMHQKWDDHRILELLENDEGRKGVTDLFRQGYLNAGLPMEKAATLAKAMVDQKIAASIKGRGQTYVIGEEQIAGIMPELKDVVQRMRRNGTAEEMIEEIVDWINKSAKGDIPGYAKSRVPIDLNAQATVNGQTIQVVDLMDQDVPGVYTFYSKEATARRAISEATGGVLNSDRAMNDMIVNMGLEAQSLGTNVDTRAVRNALQIMMGRQYDGQLPSDLRRVRDAVSLSGMGGLGESQLAELGLALNRGYSGIVGALQKGRSAAGRVRQWRGLELTPEQATDKKFLSELQEASGLFQDLYLVERRNVHFDAQEHTYSALSRIVDTATGGKYRPLLQHMQTRFTGYGVIRQFEDQIAMASIMQDIAKFFDGRDAFSTPERLRDLGVPLEEGNWLQKRLAETATYKDDGTIQTLNLNQWSDMDKNRLGVILNRYSSQQVQKGFVGESSPEMMRPDVAFLMQFKSYPMLAAEKQQARHLKFADKEAAWAMLLNAVTSATARMLRYQSVAAGIPDEKERQRYLDKAYDNLALETYEYMGFAGMTPYVANIAKGVATGTDLKDRPFSLANSVPALNYVDNYTQMLRSPLAEDSYERDMRNTQIAMPLGTIAHSNILFRLLSESTAED